MAKKRKRRRPSMITKAINVGTLLLAFSRPITHFLAGGSVNQMVVEATGGLAGEGTSGQFRKDFAIRFYGPMVAAIILKKAISMVRKVARV